MNAADRRRRDHDRHAAFIENVTGAKVTKFLTTGTPIKLVFRVFFNAQDAGRLPCFIDSRVSHPSEFIR